MNPIDPNQLSFEHLLENKVITILSRDYVIEHGINWDEVELEEITRCHTEYMTYLDDSSVFSGVLYEIYYDLTLIYYMHYKDGLRDGTEVHFYDSGKVKSYMVSKNNRLVGKSYVWYENGKIYEINDWDQKTCIEFDENGKITYQGKLSNRFS